MKFKVTETTEVDAVYLRARCGVRYWEDASVDGVVDTDGTAIPCREGDDWAPLIALDTGVVLNWTQGRSAVIHYKVCDDGAYELLDADRSVIARTRGYVPKLMSPGGSGYGDYVIMSIGADGRIAGWKPDLAAFVDDGAQD